MLFDLAHLGSAFVDREMDWDRLGITLKGPSDPSPYKKPSCLMKFESTEFVGEFELWSSGEAEVTVIRRDDERRMVKVYKVESRRDLDTAVGELVEFLSDGAVPPGGYHWDR